MKMNRRFLLTTLLMALVMALTAQSTEEQKKIINSIKKNKAYLYAEITTNDQQTALDLAEDMLNQEINKYVAEQKKLRSASNIVLRNRAEVIESISLPRGNMFRAFKYVKKNDIIPADNVEVRTNTPTVDDSGKTTAVSTTVVASTVEPIGSTKRTQTINELLTVSKFTAMVQKLSKMKQDGRVASYAKHKELDNPDKYVFIIYNKEGNVEALLSEGPARKNLRTGAADSVENYKGRGAIGVKIND